MTEQQIATLWTRMAEIYGHRWTGTFGPLRIGGTISQTAQTWRRGLDGLTPEDVTRGLRACLSAGEEWPPSLPAFFGMCRKYATAAHRPFRRGLPPPRPTPEQAAAHLARLRAALDGDAA